MRLEERGIVRVEIQYNEIVDLPRIDEYSYNLHLCKRLQESGIPIIGGPLLPKVDFSKGTLETWDDYDKGMKVFIWSPT